MSRLSIDTLQVWYGPAAVQAAPRSALSGRVGAAKEFRVADASPEHAQAAGMAALSAALRHFGLRRVEVQLAQQFVQLRVLPWRAELLNVGELEALARHDFSGAFGNIADDWRIALSDDPPGVARLAAAIAHPLLHDMQTQTAQAGARLVGVTPSLVAASRKWPARGAKEGCHWLVLHEPGRLCVLVRAQGQWFWVRHVRMEGVWWTQLTQWLQAESLMSGLALEHRNVTVVAAGLDLPAQKSLQAADLRYLDSGWRP